VVTWYDEDDGQGGYVPYSTSSVITSDVKAIPLFTDTGTGEVNSASIIIRSLKGKYNALSGSIIFAEWDRIRIQCTDLAGNSYDRYFEIINIIPSQSKGQGTLITLECLGIEYHTQHINMVRPYWFEDSYTVGLSIGQFYERNRGTKQPILSNYDIVRNVEVADYGSALPYYNPNNWDFGVSEDSCYNRWMDLVDGAGAAVEAGGALTFFELNFLTTGVNAMNFKLRASGDNTSFETVKNSFVTGVKVGEQEGMLSNPTGSNVIAWGSNEHGSLPVSSSRYDSGLMKFVFRPEWLTGISYAVNAKVKVTGTGTPAPKHYVCLTAHTSGTFATDLAAGKWAQIDMKDTTHGFGNTIQYSPWTDDKAVLWTNSGADPSRGNGFASGGWCDINLVINESDWFRTWVDAVATTDAALDTLAARYAYDGTRDTFPRGFRILVNGDSPTGDLANFANMVVEIAETNSIGGRRWQKIYTFDVMNSKIQVAVIDQAKIYEDTITGTPGSPTHLWDTIETLDYGNDCFHPYTTPPVNDKGIDLVQDSTANANLPRSDNTDPIERPDITKDGGKFTSNLDSSIKFTSLVPNALESAVVGAFTQTSQWYKSVIGATIRFPYPTTKDNSISEAVGQLYGGGATGGDGDAGGAGNELWVTAQDYSIGNIVFNSNITYICLTAHTSGTFATDLAALKWRELHGKEPSTLDIQNMNFTHDGQQGFNCINSASEDLGQISAISIWLKYSQISIFGTYKSYDHYFETGTSFANQYGGSVERVGVKITTDSPAIGTHIQKVRFSAKKTGSPTGNIVVRVRNSGDAEIASGTLDVSTLTTGFKDYEVTMTGKAVLALNSRVSVEFTGGNTANYINIEGITRTTQTGFSIFTYDGSYSDTTNGDASITFDSTQQGEFNDEHRFRAWAIDTIDNVVYQDFVVRFSNNWEDIRLPIGGFRIYKGRKPLYGFDAVISAVVPPKELEIINVFEWRNIKIFGIQTQAVYDDFGRFNPAGALVGEDAGTVGWINLTGAIRSLWIDGFRFIKPLLATSGNVTDRNIEPDFDQYPNITVYDQLLNAVKSQLEIEKFKHKEFNIESSGDEIFNIPFGDSFYLLNDELVSDSDGSVSNNIKLVAKRIEYSITKPPAGSGGLKRRILGSKVFT
jgi:hypothetical protein